MSVYLSVRLSVCPSVCLSVCLSVHLARSVCRSCLCHVASREVWVQHSRDTVVLGNTNAICFSTFSGDVARCLRSLAERSQVSPRGSPNRHFLAPAGTGAGEKPPKAHKSGKAREPTGGRPGGGGAAGAGSPRGRARGPCRSAKKAEKLENIVFLCISRQIEFQKAFHFRVDFL